MVTCTFDITLRGSRLTPDIGLYRFWQLSARYNFDPACCHLWRPMTKQKREHQGSSLGNSKDWVAQQENVCTKSIGNC